MQDTANETVQAKDGGTNSPATLEFGRLLRAGTAGFVVGCRVSQLETPSLGALVRVPVSAEYTVYGLIQEIHIDDDGLVRQLATASEVPDYVIADNRVNRNIPLEINVLSIGYAEKGKIMHLLPPRPPLSLEKIYLCSAAEMRTFLGGRRFGYFRHILRVQDFPVSEVLAAHIRQAAAAQGEADPDWVQAATRELITLLRDDYATLITVLSALGDAIPDFF